MIADAAAYHYLWTAIQALLPIALVSFLVGLVLAWLIWGLVFGLILKRRGE